MTPKTWIVDEPPWRWRNLRSLHVSVGISLWPFWIFRSGREETYTGGRRWLVLGPITLGLDYHCNFPITPSGDRWGGLSEMEAYRRTMRAQEPGWTEDKDG